MDLFTPDFFNQIVHPPDFETGLIIAEHKERYRVITAQGESDAEITGHLRFTALSREDFPAVGDFVALKLFPGGPAIIHQVLPRKSLFKRQAVNQSEVQVIAANIDVAFLVQAADRDFNINRLQRFLTLCYEAKVSPVIVITKTDLFPGSFIEEIKQRISQRILNVPVLTLSNTTQEGFPELKRMLEKGKTYCLLGSSGVGKSSMLNTLLGNQTMRTGAISTSTQKGKHVTTHRELHLLENGSLLIDNPGIREVGIADASIGIEATFDTILSLAAHCHYKDCTHHHEKGCAVNRAVEKGEIDAASWENYQKLEREKTHYETSQAERHQKDRVFGKMLKDYYKKNLKQR